MKAHKARPHELHFILTQILLATIIQREYALLEREEEDIAPAVTAAFEQAGRVKAAFVSMLTARERAAARVSFPALLADIPRTTQLPYAPDAEPPHSYLLRTDADLSLVVRERSGVCVAA